MSAALHRLVGHLRRWSGPMCSDGPTDRQLLERFAAARDESAFTELVRRHGPMVLGVARRVLGNAHDAEDVLQATFMVLARKASSVSWRESVGGWLFPVVYHLALKVRAGRERRRAHEARVPAMPAAEHEAGRETELRAVLDEELDRLPDHYRDVVVLCYLEGRSRSEAAESLGLSVNEVRGRLERARQRLRTRLTRRGVVLTAALATLAGRQALAALPPESAEIITWAAVSFATGAATAASRAVDLARGALKTMTYSTTRNLFLIALAVALLGVGSLLLPGGDPPAVAGESVRPRPAPARDDKPPAGRKPKNVIVLWMSGGPSTIDLWDLKPGNANGGPFKEIDTNVKGLKISEHLPQMAKQMDKLALIRSMTHNEGDHNRSQTLMRTGRAPGDLDGPPITALLAKELAGGKWDVPPHVRVNPTPLVDDATGFLPPEYGPLVATTKGDVEAAATMPPAETFERFYKEKGEAMRKAVEKAFDLKEEKKGLRQDYGATPFGQGCLLARRLVEAGVPVVEVNFDGWDTHAKNFDAVKQRCEVLDPAFASLMQDLAERKLLDQTLIVWMGEFGRTPQINANDGRDHWPRSFSVVLGGCGVKGGVVVGKTSDDGTTIDEQPVTPAELHATIYKALGIDPEKTNKPDKGDPVPLVDKGTKPVKDVLK